MWGSDFPHDEGTYPFTTLSLRQIFHDWPEEDLRRVLAENAAAMDGFDLEALAGAGSRLGPAGGGAGPPLAPRPGGPPAGPPCPPARRRPPPRVGTAPRGPSRATA